MGFMVTAAYLGGSQVLVIIPRALITGNITGKTVGEEIVVLCIHEHMQTMLENADTIIALFGGFGTLEEIFQITSWTQLNIHQKPICRLIVNGFYNSLFFFLDHAVEKIYLTSDTLDSCHCYNS
ncbi:hypothetical protein REPUB_Repub09cG0112000 [Reevesia pubescens]